MKNIFVSSTFRDMQAERDLIQKEVLPPLRSMARKYGENMNMIDLRWGVDTSELESEEGYKKVLSVCLDGVERSRPYMLIFLGERYGSSMPPQLVAQVIERMNSDFKLEDYNISITGLEIEFGVFSQQLENFANCVVCMRHFSPMQIAEETERMIYAAEDCERARKQQELKNRIKEKLQGNVIEYTCDWDENRKQLVNFRTMEETPLSEELIRVYEKMLQEEAKEELFWAEQEQRIVDALIERKLCDFKGREELIERYYQKLWTENGILLLQGATGSGKTSILCKLIERLRNDGEKVFCFAANHSPQSETAFYFVRQMLYYLEAVQGKAHYEVAYLENRKAELEKADGATRYIEAIFEEKEKHLGSYEEWLVRLKKQIAELDAEEKIYIVIDGVDQMRQEDAVKYLDFLFPYPQVRYLLSANCEYKITRTENKCSLVTEQIPPLTIPDKTAVLEGLLTASSRNTYKEIQKEVLGKKSSDNPFYISMLVQRLNMMGVEELLSAGDEQTIISHGTEVVRNVPDDAKEAAVYLLKEAVERLGAKEQGLSEVINLIGSSRKGLRESDILAITASMGWKVRQLDLLRLMHYMDAFFVTHKDGRIDFSHKVIREGVCREIADDRYEKAIAKRVKELGADFEDLFWQSEGMYYARLTEDFKAADEVFYRAKVSDVVLAAIKQEALADKGEFYCKCMNHMEKAETFFASEWYGMWQITQTEWEINEKVLRCFISRMEEKRASGEKSYHFLFHLAEAYAKMSDIISKHGDIGKREIFSYRKKVLEIRRLMAEQFPNKRAQGELAMEYGRFGNELLESEEAESKQEAEFYLNESVRYAKELLKDQIAEDKYDANMLLLWSCYVHRANGYFRQEKYEDAAGYYDKALELVKKLGEEEGKDKFLYKSYTNKAAALKKAGNGEEAIACYRLALGAVADNQSYKRVLENRCKISQDYLSIAEILHEQEKDEEAFADYLSYLEMEEEIYFAAPTWTGARKIFTKGTELGNRYMQKQLWMQAGMFFEKALCAAKEVDKMDRDEWSARELSVAYDNVGKALHKMKKNDKALENYYESLRIVKALYETDQSIQIVSDLAICYNNIGYVLLSEGDWQEASRIFKQALEQKKKAYRMEPTVKLLWELSVTYENIVDALDYRQKSDASLPYLIGTIVTRVQYYLAKKTNYDKCESYINSAINFLKRYEAITTDAEAPKFRAMVQETYGDYLMIIGECEVAQSLYYKACRVLEKMLEVTEDEEAKEILVRVQRKIE